MKAALLLLATVITAPQVAVAQGQVSQIWNAALESGVITPNDDTPLFRRALTAAFSPSSAMHAHERLLLWLRNLPMQTGETRSVSPAQICQFYERVNGLHELQADSSWQAQLFLNESFFEVVLYDDPRDQRRHRACGAGVLRSLTLTQRADDRTLELVFTKDLNFLNKRLDLALKSGGAYDVAAARACFYAFTRGAAACRPWFNASSINAIRANSTRAFPITTIFRQNVANRSIISNWSE